MRIETRTKKFPARRPPVDEEMKEEALTERQERKVEADKAIRTIYRELITRAVETDQAESVIAAQHEQIQELQTELAACKEGDEPTRPPKDEPPVIVDPPRGGAMQVQVSWYDGSNNDGIRLITLETQLAEALPGVWISPMHFDCNAPVILTESHGLIVVTLVNCFEGTGDVDVRDLEIIWPSGAVESVESFTLLSGQMASFQYDLGAKLPNPGTAHPEALPQVEKWWAKFLSGGGGFSQLGPVRTFGPKQANEGGAGFGIYGMGMEKLLGSELGLRLAHEAGRAGLNRQRCGRFHRDDWREGRLVPATIPEFEGFDKTRSSSIPGFGDQADKVDGKNQYDSSHIARLASWLYFAGKHGLVFARFALRVLADEVRLGWCERSSKAEGLIEVDNAWAYSWFGCYEILDHYPAGQGCHLMGRGFAHDLTILANAEELWPGRYTEDLSLMARTIRHVWNEQQGCVYLIPFADPIFEGNTIGAWKKKVAIDDDTLPLGFYPPVARTFEAVLLHYAMERLDDVWGDGLHFDILARHRETLLMYPYELRCVGAEQYSDKDQALGTLNMLGVAGDKWNNGRTFEELLPTKPLWSDQPLYSWHPSLVPTP